MSRLSPVLTAVLTLAAAFSFGSVLTAQEPISVTLDSPDPFAPAFGEIEIVAVVASEEEIERVVFYVDGVVVGELKEPPYTFKTDIGDSFSAHRFEVVAHALSGNRGTGAVKTPALRINEQVSIDLQQLYVTVSRDGKRVPDLTADHFTILDEGSRQNMVTFARGDIPFTALVLLDASTSMEGEKLRAALQGASTFFNDMRPLDEGQLLVFSDRILHSTPFTTFSDVLTAGLGGVKARGGTAINDHLYLAMKKLEQRQGRRVVMLLSDGVDSHSVLAMSDVLAVARRSQALIYWLRLPYRGSKGHEVPQITTMWRNNEEYVQEFDLLQRTIEESGGRIELIRSIHEIDDAFRNILEELRDQYVLGYYPAISHHNGAWRRVTVRVSRPVFDVRSRDGYYDF